MSTGKRRLQDVPHKGWVCIDVEDMGEPDAVCEMCETQEIRYVHTMEHPDYPDILGCGCVCAGHMEENPIGARTRENRLKARERRKQALTRRHWRMSASGNEFLNTDGYNIVVYQNGAVWGARVENRATGFCRFSKLPYQTADKAKLAALNVMLRAKYADP
jgi:hypothetical protein